MGIIPRHSSPSSGNYALRAPSEDPNQVVARAADAAQAGQEVTATFANYYPPDTAPSVSAATSDAELLNRMMSQTWGRRWRVSQPAATPQPDNVTAATEQRPMLEVDSTEATAADDFMNQSYSDFILEDRELKVTAGTTGTAVTVSPEGFTVVVADTLVLLDQNDTQWRITVDTDGVIAAQRR